MQSLLGMIYPRQCVLCENLVEGAGGLCGTCWRDTPFVIGLCCDGCGAPLLGDSETEPRCDDCMNTQPPWSRGRAAMLYRDKGRTLVLALKHGDRLDLAPPAAGWMHRAAAPLLRPGQILVPVPAHWTRTLRRRYNQAAVLAHLLARAAGSVSQPRALTRTRATAVQDGQGREGRVTNLAGAIQPHPKHGKVLHGAEILLVDDVMTSGATLSESTRACIAAGARRVDVVTLARVAQET